MLDAIVVFVFHELDEDALILLASQDWPDVGALVQICLELAASSPGFLFVEQIVHVVVVLECFSDHLLLLVFDDV